MYAVIKTGGKQYQVQTGDVVFIEKIDKETDAEVVFEDVLMVSGAEGVKVGTPNVSGARVVGKVLGQTKGKKVIVFKYKPKKGYRNKNGHRQPYTKVEITSIEA